MRDLLRDNRRILIYLILSNLFLFFGFSLWQTMFNNFAVEELGIGPAGIGWVQAVRELPGLLGFLLGFLALVMSEVRIMAFSVILMGVGLFMTGQSYGIPILLVSTLVMSFGFHFFYPSNQAVVLMVTEKQQAPKILGQLGSLQAVAAVAATGMVYLLVSGAGYRTVFMVVGVIIALGGVALLPWKGARESLPPRRKVILRRKYWLFYTLAFLMGSRRHIFTTFAIFLLVSKFGISVQTTATLFLVNSLVNVFTLRLVGRLVGHLGERVMLSIAFGTLIFVFLGYAYVTVLPILFVLFVIDNVIFGVDLALTTYFQKIAVTQEEITSNLSTQQAINHISALVVPVLGGTVWAMFGSQAPFLGGVAIAVISLILVQAMHTPSQPLPVPVTTGAR